MIPFTGLPKPGMRWIAPESSCRPFETSNSTISPMRGTPWCPEMIPTIFVAEPGSGRA